MPEPIHGPTSHSYFSQRLRLHYVDWGNAGAPPQFTRGYGLVFGHAERKAMAMALCDRALRARELGE